MLFRQKSQSFIIVFVIKFALNEGRKKLKLYQYWRLIAFRSNQIGCEWAWLFTINAINWRGNHFRNWNSVFHIGIVVNKFPNFEIKWIGWKLCKTYFSINSMIFEQMMNYDDAIWIELYKQNKKLKLKSNAIKFNDHHSNVCVRNVFQESVVWRMIWNNLQNFPFSNPFPLCRAHLTRQYKTKHSEHRCQYMVIRVKTFVYTLSMLHVELG